MKTLTKEINILNNGIIQYPILTNGLGWKSSEKENLSVIESGENKILFSKIIKAIDSAKEIVCLQSFLIQDTKIIDALIKAVEERQVKVFVLSSAEARLKETIEDEQDFIKTNYIQLLESKFKNHFLHRSAENFHGKYILIDPKTNPNGFLCTNNFTENGFTKNPELAVELNKEQCEELFKVFVFHFWEFSTDEQTALKEFEKVKTVGKFKLPKLESILLTTPDSTNCTLNKTLLQAVQGATKSISFSTFLLDKNTELVKTILEKSKQGIEVTLFCRPIEKQFNEQLKELLESEVQIFMHSLIHAKSILIDDTTGFLFTSNLISNGLENGFEVGVTLNNQQTTDISIIHQNWKKYFPLKAVKQAKIVDLKEFEFFKEQKISKRVLLDDKKENKRKIVKVLDLISFFNQEYEIKDHYVRSLKINLTAEIENILPKYKTITENDFEIIEIEEVNKKKIKIVAIKNSFNLNDLPKLSELKDCKIYFA